MIGMGQKEGSQGASSATDGNAIRAGEQNDSPASLMERVGASASGLMQSSWGSSSTDGVTSDLALLHASVSKGESSSSSARAGAISTARTSGVIPTQNSPSRPSQNRESFRSQQSLGTLDVPTTQDRFNHFVSGMDVSNFSNASNRKNIVEEASSPVASDPPQSTIQSVEMQSPRGTGEWGGSEYASAVSNDGASVVALLSNPAWDMDDGPADMWAPSSEEFSALVDNDKKFTSTASSQGTQRANQLLTDNGIEPETLSDAQLMSFQQQNFAVQQKSIEIYIQSKAKRQRRSSGESPLTSYTPQQGAADRILDSQNLLAHSNEISSPDRRDLETSAAQQQVQVSKLVLSLIPDFGDSEPRSMLSNMEEGDRRLLVKGLAESGRCLIQPWLSILDKYQDEVWGDVLPLVQEAREEVKTAKESDGSKSRDMEEGPAVRRLKMVLQHLDRSR